VASYRQLLFDAFCLLPVGVDLEMYGAAYGAVCYGDELGPLLALALLAESQLHTSLYLCSSSKLHLLHSQLSISPQVVPSKCIDPSNMHYHSSM
jgi:hypothetical protein